ncbi:MAG: hypothetical protein IJT11_06545 [Bacteroidaceae bacterium]|nr:hypothetical protein [Bacteroidaceae bacterium]
MTGRQARVAEKRYSKERPTPQQGTANATARNRKRHTRGRRFLHVAFYYALSGL